jgi:hypothetical protein
MRTHTKESTGTILCFGGTGGDLRLQAPHFLCQLGQPGLMRPKLIHESSHAFSAINVRLRGFFGHQEKSPYYTGNLGKATLISDPGCKI